MVKVRDGVRVRVRVKGGDEKGVNSNPNPYSDIISNPIPFSTNLSSRSSSLSLSIFNGEDGLLAALGIGLELGSGLKLRLE
jgi:hypothetical protein